MFYCGIPYGERGGIFSDIKYKSDDYFDMLLVEEMYHRYVSQNNVGGKILIISDETLTEQPEIYYTPQMLPVRTIAERLRHLCPNSKILFTVRNQLSYVISSYLNIKRNYALLSRRPLEEFDLWFEGNHSQVANLFLRNLDYEAAIRVYIQVFGRESVFVLPLEHLIRDGAESYMRTLGEYMDILITEEDLQNLETVRNRRMTVAEAAMLELSLRVRVSESDLRYAVGKGAPVEIVLSQTQIEQIVARSFAGNLFISQEFGIPLASYGYP
jgi:hypothetical protein